MKKKEKKIAFLHVCTEAMFIDRKLLLAGNFLWDPFSFNGCWELCKYSTDTHGEVKI
jgi:hypothetical protein